MSSPQPPSPCWTRKYGAPAPSSPAIPCRKSSDIAAASRAFLRICSGQYQKGAKLWHVRTQKPFVVNQALTFLAANREQVEEAFAGDIIGIYNHGGVQIGDTFTEGENLKFSGIPNFAPELFRRVRLKDPLKAKALQKGLIQLSEEGATQVFRPMHSNDLILGAVGVLQFDVVAFRLLHEYGVECVYENVNVVAARWVDAPDAKSRQNLEQKAAEYMALDGANHLTYLAPTRVNLQLAEERYPEVVFRSTREH